MKELLFGTIWLSMNAAFTAARVSTVGEPGTCAVTVSTAAQLPPIGDTAGWRVVLQKTEPVLYRGVAAIADDTTSDNGSDMESAQFPNLGQFGIPRGWIPDETPEQVGKLSLAAGLGPAVQGFIRRCVRLSRS